MNKKEIEKKVIEFFKLKFHDNKVDKNWIINKEYEEEVLVMYVLDDFFYDFKINPKNFNLSNYFYPEPTSFNLKEIWNNIIGKTKYPPKPPLTIEHLIEVAERGEWFDPE